MNFFNLFLIIASLAAKIALCSSSGIGLAMTIPSGGYVYTDDGENIRYFESFMQMVDATPSGVGVDVFSHLDSSSLPPPFPRSLPRSSDCSCEGCKYRQKTIDRVKTWRARHSVENFLFVIDEENVLMSARNHYIQNFLMNRGRDTTNQRVFITFGSANSRYETKDFTKFMTLLIQDAIKYNILALNSQNELIIPVREFIYTHTWTYEMLGFFICHALRNNIKLRFPLSRPLVEAIRSGKPAAVFYDHFRAFDSELFDRMEELIKISKDHLQYYTVVDMNGNERPVTEGLLPLLVQKQVMERIILPAQLPLIYLAFGFCRAAPTTVFQNYPVDMFIKDLDGSPTNALDVERFMENVRFNGTPEQALQFREALTSLTADKQMSLLQYFTRIKSAANQNRRMVLRNGLELPRVSKYIRDLLLPIYSLISAMRRNLARVF